jgi:hypothetical protein
MRLVKVPGPVEEVALVAEDLEESKRIFLVLGVLDIIQN